MGGAVDGTDLVMVVRTNTLVPTNLVQKMSDIIYPYPDVRGFGAKGDGIHDDTTNINACLATRTNAYFPEGTYIVSAPLLVRSNSHVWGQGARTMIKGVNPGSVVSTLFFVSNADNVVIEKMTIAGDIGISNAIMVLSFGGTSKNITFRDLFITGTSQVPVGFWNAGIMLLTSPTENMWDIGLDHVVVNTVAGDGLKMHGVADSSYGAVVNVTDCDFTGCNGFAINFAKGVESTFVRYSSLLYVKNTVLESSYSNLIYASDCALTIDSCRFEQDADKTNILVYVGGSGHAHPFVCRNSQFEGGGQNGPGLRAPYIIYLEYAQNPVVENNEWQNADTAFVFVGNCSQAYLHNPRPMGGTNFVEWSIFDGATNTMIFTSNRLELIRSEIDMVGSGVTLVPTNVMLGRVKFSHFLFPNQYSSVEGFSGNDGANVEWLRFMVAYGATTEAMRINEIGQVGIGTAFPVIGLKLDVPGTSAFGTIRTTNGPTVVNYASLGSPPRTAYWDDTGKLLAGAFFVGGFQPANATLTNLSLLANALGRLTNDGTGVLGWDTSPMGLTDALLTNLINNPSTGWTNNVHGDGATVISTTNAGGSVVLSAVAGSASATNAIVSVGTNTAFVSGSLTTNVTFFDGLNIKFKGTNASGDVSIGADVDLDPLIQSATNYANGTTNASIVRQTQLTIVSNSAIAGFQSGSNLSYTLSDGNTNHASEVLKSSTNYANGVTNVSIVRQTQLTLCSNDLRAAMTGHTDAQITNIATNSIFLASGPNVTISASGTDAGFTYTISASLAGGAASLGDVTNIINALVRLNGRLTNLTVWSQADNTTNLTIYLDDYGTRTAPIIQVIDKPTGDVLLNLDNDASLSLQGRGSLIVSNAQFSGIVSSTNIDASILSATNASQQASVAVANGGFQVNSNRITGLTNYFVSKTNGWSTNMVIDRAVATNLVVKSHALGYSLEANGIANFNEVDIQGTNVLDWVRSKSNFVVSAHGTAVVTNNLSVGITTSNAPFTAWGPGTGKSSFFSGDNYGGYAGLWVANNGSLGLYCTNYNYRGLSGSFGGALEAAIGGQGAFPPEPMLAFTRSQAAGGEGLSHYVTSMHYEGDSVLNSIDFWINTSATMHGSRPDLTGNRKTLSITGTGASVVGQLTVGTNMTLMTSIVAPTVTGTNNGILWASNNTLFWTWTAGGTITNTAKIQGP